MIASLEVPWRRRFIELLDARFTNLQFVITLSASGRRQFPTGLLHRRLPVPEAQPRPRPAPPASSPARVQPRPRPAPVRRLAPATALLQTTPSDNVAFVCMYGFNTTLAEDVERFRFLHRLGQLCDGWRGMGGFDLVRRRLPTYTRCHEPATPGRGTRPRQQA